MNPTGPDNAGSAVADSDSGVRGPEPEAGRHEIESERATAMGHVAARTDSAPSPASGSAKTGQGAGIGFVGSGIGIGWEEASIGVESSTVAHSAQARIDPRLIESCVVQPEPGPSAAATAEVVWRGGWKERLAGTAYVDGIVRFPVYSSQQAGNYHVPSAVRWA